MFARTNSAATQDAASHLGWAPTSYTRWEQLEPTSQYEAGVLGYTEKLWNDTVYTPHIARPPVHPGERDSKVERLRSVYKEMPIAQAQYYLEQSGWDVAQACSLYGAHMGHAPADLISTNSQVERRIQADADAEREKERQEKQRIADQLFEVKQELLALLIRTAPKPGTTVTCKKAGPSGIPKIGHRGVVVQPREVFLVTPGAKAPIPDDIMVKWDLPHGVDPSLLHESLQQPYAVPVRGWEAHIQAVAVDLFVESETATNGDDLNLTGKWTVQQKQGLLAGKYFSYEWKHALGTSTFDGAQTSFDGAQTQYPIANAKIIRNGSCFGKVINVSWDVVAGPSASQVVHCKGQLTNDSGVITIRGRSQHRDYHGEFEAHKRGHALTSQQASITVTCDGCGMQGQIGLYGRSCRVCNIDFCEECYASAVKRGPKWP